MKELQEGQTWARLLGIMKSLADPVRLSLILDTRNGPKTYRELIILTHKTKSQISKHVTLLKKLELVQTMRKDKQVHIWPTPLATTLFQTLKGVILQKYDQQAGIDHKSSVERDKNGVTIPIQTIHELLRDQAHFLDLLLLTAQIDEQAYWEAISELLQLAERYGLELDIVRLPGPPPKTRGRSSP